MAIDARPIGILRIVLSEGARVAAVDVVAGSIGALGLGRLMAGQLCGVTPYDAGVCGIATVGLFGVALAATAAPTICAMRMDPLRALRD